MAAARRSSFRPAESPKAEIVRDMARAMRKAGLLRETPHKPR
jgi:hypothetical protein